MWAYWLATFFLRALMQVPVPAASSHCEQPRAGRAGELPAALRPATTMRRLDSAKRHLSLSRGYDACQKTDPN